MLVNLRPRHRQPNMAAVHPGGLGSSATHQWGAMLVVLLFLVYANQKTVARFS